MSYYFHYLWQRRPLQRGTHGGPVGLAAAPHERHQAVQGGAHEQQQPSHVEAHVVALGGVVYASCTHKITAKTQINTINNFFK